ncbi:MAG: hypothetical protein ACKOZW_15365 [Cyanobium sp.]
MRAPDGAKGLGGWRGLKRGLLAALLLLAMVLLAPSGAALAGPVDWQEVPATAEGRLSVLSRFQPAEGREGAAALYVMQLDCDQQLFRDTSVNGLPRFRSDWQAVAQDGLGAAVIQQACAAWAERHPS